MKRTNYFFLVPTADKVTKCDYGIPNWGKVGKYLIIQTWSLNWAKAIPRNVSFVTRINQYLFTLGFESRIALVD